MEDEKDLIAKVGEEKLYASELSQITKGLSGKDSLMALKSYTDQWVRKKVLIGKALDNINESELNIEGLVNDYRESLILFEYEKELVYQKLDTTIKQDEFSNYYEKHKGGFDLPQDMFLVFYIKLPTDAPDLKEARKWILNPKDEEEKIMAEGYCKQFSSGYELSKGLWFNASSLEERFKVSAATASGMSGSDKFREFPTEDGLLYLKVPAMFRQGTTAPVDFVSEEIRKIILENRKSDLINNIYKKAYNDAIQSGNAEIFIR